MSDLSNGRQLYTDVKDIPNAPDLPDYGICQNGQYAQHNYLVNFQQLANAIAAALAGNAGEEVVQVFDENDAIAAQAENIEIVSYTVPVGKVFRLKLAEISGDNRSEITVLSNSTKIGFKRLDDTQWNEPFEYFNLEFSAGTVIKITINNCSGHVGDFKGRILGGLIDA